MGPQRVPLSKHDELVSLALRLLWQQSWAMQLLYPVPETQGARHPKQPLPQDPAKQKGPSCAHFQVAAMALVGLNLWYPRMARPSLLAVLELPSHQRLGPKRMMWKVLQGNLGPRWRKSWG